MAQVGQGAGLDRAAVPDDGDPVAERLDLGQDVAGQQHGAVAAAHLLADHLAEHRLHQRVQAGGRLVEQQQLDVGGERGDQRHLLPVALGVGAALLARVEVEALAAGRRGAAGSRPPRIRPSRSITSPPDRLGHSVTSPGT